MGSVKHTVSVKCVQVDRGGPSTLRAAGERPARRDGRIRLRKADSHRQCTQRRTTAAQANGKNDALRFTVGCSTLNPRVLSPVTQGLMSAVVYWMGDE
ncbi:hypothetical protein bgla_1g07310 [Burkholderia gladioli BSR3]|uniref:Uncharacterized protein n=1 Tax=Burkholderia gladioli (strain BSR3) TaxID=999541 RepID=F2LAN6_BURGS|nr:hypothetical protein bgla_1g07310 [Burkholderia gladioli BSR3]